MTEKDDNFKHSLSEKSDALSEDIFRKQQKKIIIYSVVSWFIYSGCYKLIPQFSETFRAFGTKLPSLTELVISNYQWLHYLAWFSVLPLVSLFKGSVKVLQLKNFATWTKVNLFVAGVVFLVVLVSLYLPVIQLSQ